MPPTKREIIFNKILSDDTTGFSKGKETIKVFKDHPEQLQFCRKCVLKKLFVGMKL